MKVVLSNLKDTLECEARPSFELENNQLVLSLFTSEGYELSISASITDLKEVISKLER